MSIKKPSQEQTSSEGVLLRETLNVLVDSKPESDLDNFEAAFKKSREEEQERIAEFAEWIEDITRQSHQESDIEYDLMEPGPQTEAPIQLELNDVPTELTADLDDLVSEADTIETERERKEEKVDNAERSL